MRRDEFEALVADAFAALPERFRKRVENVALLVDNEPSREVRREEELENNETLFGRYVGVPAIHRDSSYGVGGTLPDTITIYRRPIEEEAGGDPDAVRAIVFDTMWHEIAHHLGMEEDEIREREANKKS